MRLKEEVENELARMRYDVECSIEKGEDEFDLTPYLESIMSLVKRYCGDKEKS